MRATAPVEHRATLSFAKLILADGGDFVCRDEFEVGRAREMDEDGGPEMNPPKPVR